MGYMLNPMSHRLGYSRTWTDSWFTRKLYYPAILHGMMQVKMILLYLLRLRHVEKRNFYVHHVVLSHIGGRVRMEIYMYEAGKWMFWRFKRICRFLRFTGRYIRTFPRRHWFGNIFLKFNLFDIKDTGGGQAAKRLFLFTKMLGLDPESFFLQSLDATEPTWVVNKLEALRDNMKKNDSWMAWEELKLLKFVHYRLSRVGVDTGWISDYGSDTWKMLRVLSFLMLGDYTHPLVREGYRLYQNVDQLGLRRMVPDEIFESISLFKIRRKGFARVRFSYVRLFFILGLVKLLSDKLRWFKNRMYSFVTVFEITELLMYMFIRVPFYEGLNLYLSGVISSLLGKDTSGIFFLMTNDELYASFIVRHIGWAFKLRIKWRDVVVPIKRDLRFQLRPRFVFMDGLEASKVKKLMGRLSGYMNYLVMFRLLDMFSSAKHAHFISSLLWQRRFFKNCLRCKVALPLVFLDRNMVIRRASFVNSVCLVSSEIFRYICLWKEWSFFHLAFVSMLSRGVAFLWSQVVSLGRLIYFEIGGFFCNILLLLYQIFYGSRFYYKRILGFRVNKFIFGNKRLFCGYWGRGVFFNGKLSIIWSFWKKVSNFFMWDLSYFRGLFLMNNNVFSKVRTFFKELGFQKITYFIKDKTFLKVRSVLMNTRDKLQKHFMNMPVLGFKLRFSGRLRRRSRKARVWFLKGYVPISQRDANIDYGMYVVPLKYSTVSVRIWIYKNELYSQYALKLDLVKYSDKELNRVLINGVRSFIFMLKDFFYKNLNRLLKVWIFLFKHVQVGKVLRKVSGRFKVVRLSKVNFLRERNVIFSFVAHTQRIRGIFKMYSGFFGKALEKKCLKSLPKRLRLELKSGRSSKQRHMLYKKILLFMLSKVNYKQYKKKFRHRFVKFFKFYAKVRKSKNFFRNKRFWKVALKLAKFVFRRRKVLERKSKKGKFKKARSKYKVVVKKKFNVRRLKRGKSKKVKRIKSYKSGKKWVGRDGFISGYKKTRSYRLYKPGKKFYKPGKKWVGRDGFISGDDDKKTRSYRLDEDDIELLNRMEREKEALLRDNEYHLMFTGNKKGFDRK